MPADTAFMDKLTALCKRRGFIYQSSEIYGGIGGFWDYGPLGVELKRNIKDLWWHDMVTNPPIGPDGHEVEMVGVDCSIIMNPKVWEASGHATGFADPMVDCKECKSEISCRPDPRGSREDGHGRRIRCSRSSRRTQKAATPESACKTARQAACTPSLPLSTDRVHVKRLTEI